MVSDGDDDVAVDKGDGFIDEDDDDNAAVTTANDDGYDDHDGLY